MSKYTFVTTLIIFVTLFINAAHSTPVPATLQKREEFSGDGTYYNTGLGACGIESHDSDFIAAINKPQFGDSQNPNTNPICGKQASVKGPKGSVTIKILDMCPECVYGSLDLSPAAFDQIADRSAGRVKITWHFVDSAATITKATIKATTTKATTKATTTKAAVTKKKKTTKKHSTKKKSTKKHSTKKKSTKKHSTKKKSTKKHSTKKHPTKKHSK
ncbi:1254_t:CDS:2 [Ambispora gerdemannii]|uniref:1254_t:CDS:1 n=1 Tax=Ambispora gerdemannii TaxID=144530 RepID=A0A9N8ZAG2_9GLOM|nr:1254_t:CDS:2 [Ambispora gerdemannii]